MKFFLSGLKPDDEFISLLYISEGWGNYQKIRKRVKFYKKYAIFINNIYNK